MTERREYLCDYCGKNFGCKEDECLKHEKICEEKYIKQLQKKSNFIELPQNSCINCKFCYNYWCRDEIYSFECKRYYNKKNKWVRFKTKPCNYCDNFQLLQEERKFEK